MNKLLPLLFLGSLFLSSCEQNGLSYLERKAVGEWKFVEVEHRESYKSSKQDVTEDFKNRTLILKEDKQAFYEMEENGDNYSGRWDTELVEDPDSDPECPTYTRWLRLTLNRDIDNEPIRISWSAFMSTRKKLKGNKMENGGVYYYTLMKAQEVRTTNNSSVHVN